MGNVRCFFSGGAASPLPFCLCLVLLRDGLEKCYADSADDILGGASAGKIVHRLCEALKVGTNRRRAAKTLCDLVSDVSGLKVGEDEHVRIPLHRTVRVLELSDGRNNGGVNCFIKNVPER